MGDSTYLDLQNLSEITMDSINVSNLNCETIVTEDLTVNGSLLGLNTSTNSIFNYTYTPSSRTFNLTLQNQSGSNYIIITDGTGAPVWTLLNPYIYPLLSGVAPILYNSLTGAFSLDTTIAQNETFTGLVTITANTSSTISRSNQVYVQNTSANQEMYLIGVRVTASGYDDIRGDLSGNISFNPNSHRLTTGYFRSTDTSLSTMAGSLDITGYVNISSGNTYKINNVSQTFLNGLTTTPTSTITHTFVSPNLQSNINNLSITDGLIANSTISNGKLVNSSITLGNTAMSLGSTYTTIGGNMTWTGPTTTFSPTIATNTVINIGNTLATSTSQITMRSLAGNGTIKQDGGVLKIDNGFISLNSSTTTGYIEHYSITNAYKPILIPYGVSNIVTPSACDAGLIIGDFNTTKDGGLILESASSASSGSTIQQNASNLYIDNHSSSSSINIGTKTTTPTINIGGNTIVSGTIKGTKVTGTDSTSNITNLPDSVSSVASGVVNSKDGVIHIYSATNPLSTGGGVLQINNNAFYIDSCNALNGIFIGTRNSCPVLVEEIRLVNPSSNYSINSPVTSVYPSSAPVKVNYFNTGYQALVGSCTTNLISPNWTRITGTNTLEVSLYIAESSSCSFKIEGQINSYYTSTNTGTNINCKVFRDSASTATATGTAGFVNSLFINRNINGGSNVNTIIPFSAIYTSPSGYPGECYTFTMYFQSFTTFANGSTAGRAGATPDVPSVLIVTQLD